MYRGCLQLLVPLLEPQLRNHHPRCKSDGKYKNDQTCSNHEPDTDPHVISSKFPGHMVLPKVKDPKIRWFNIIFPKWSCMAVWVSNPFIDKPAWAHQKVAITSILIGSAQLLNV